MELCRQQRLTVETWGLEMCSAQNAANVPRLQSHGDIAKASLPGTASENNDG